MTKKPLKRKTKAPKPYHHGNLVEALIAVTVEIIEERGVEHVSVREAAKRAGVSPGAPFQHFRSKTALLTAVAEQAMGRLTQAVAAAQSKADAHEPIAVLEAIGSGYLQWALANPTHFEIINSRTLIEFEASDSLRTQNEAIRQRMFELLTKARKRGQLIEGLDLNYVVLTARALVYGLARMAIDGHFPRWHPSEPPPQAMRQALRLFIGQITASPIK
jgi:AcrR family transcriptional regulator